jgi:hypothetical protein
MKTKPTNARGARAKIKKDTRSENQIFDEEGMSPFHDIHLRTPAGNATKINLGNKQHRIAFEAACRMKATTQEITHLLGLREERHLKAAVKDHYGLPYAEVYAVKSAEGVISLRRSQWMSAVRDRNVTMMIWLGKQYLGQKDRFEMDLPGEDAEAVHFYIPAIIRPQRSGEPKPDPDSGVHISEQ